MNFRILSTSLFTAALALTACGNPTLSEPLTLEHETYTGTFSSLGSINVADSATHLFETEEGDVLYAFSDRYDLDEYKTSMEAYGVVTTYAELDKALFEVTRLTEPSETVVETEAVTKVEYRNAELGIVTQIYSNWEVDTTSTVGLISFKIPYPLEEGATPAVTDLKDSVDLIYLSEALTTTADSTTEERNADLKNYVIQNYQDLAMITSDAITVGVDKVSGLRYKTAAGDIYVFIPRGSDLLELSYHYLHMDDALRIQNTNFFSGLLNDFRFIPTGSTEEPAETVVTADDVTAPTVTQVEISTFATLSSNAFTFSMSYPAAWYYVGGSTGYSFSAEAIEDVNAEALLKMEFNTGALEGTVRTGSLVAVTKKVDSRSYTLTGTSEYETVIRTMLDSIQTTKAE